jgi:Lrp/AsnC family transcriptional regulator for asnA, asnC and gidA
LESRLDDLDRKLIARLTEDASVTNVSLARELGVSDVTVHNHVQRLLGDGIIEIVAIVDPWKVGHRIQIISGIEVELGHLHQTAEALAALEQTTYVAYTTGEYDLIVVSVLASSTELFHYLSDVIPTIPGVRRIRTSQILKAIKRSLRYDQVLAMENGGRTGRSAGRQRPGQRGAVRRPQRA